MDESATLIGRLEALAPPEPEPARRRAVESVPPRLRAGTANGRHRPIPARPRFVVALAAVCLALSAAALFTPPGHAFTSWVGDRLGFGHPGEHPTLRQLRHFAMQDSAAAGQPAYVLVRGPAPGIGHYEFITYRNKREAGKAWPVGGRCFEIDFPEARNLAAAGCGLPSARHPVLTMGPGGNSQPGAAYTYIDGRISDEVAKVEVEQNGHPAAVEMTQVPEDLIRGLRIRRPFSLFIAFPEYAPHGGTILVIGRDASGAEIARRSFSNPDPTVFLRQSYRRIR